MDADAPDIDFSADDGWAETRLVFLDGCGLPEAWRARERFVVSELGFGTGLNALALAKLADDERRKGARVPALVFQSAEWRLRTPDDHRALGRRWPELAFWADELAAQAFEPGWNRRALSWGTLLLYLGDARDLPASTAFEAADAWFLDGYAPSKAPELWDPALLAWVGRLTKAGGRAATYTAAGEVKRALRAAGFDVVRRPGHGRKRHRLEAKLV